MAAIMSETNERMFGGRTHMDIAENEATSVYKKTNRQDVTRWKLTVIMLATACSLSVQGIACFKYIRQSAAIHLNLFFHWLQSCIITLILHVWTRQRTRSIFRNSSGYLVLLIALHLLLVTIHELDKDRSLYGASGGSEIYQVGLAAAPLVVLLATWHLFHQFYPVRIVACVGLSSLLLMAIVCSENDPYIPFKVTFVYGALGILNGTLMAYYVVLLKKQVLKLSPSQLLYSLNLACVVALPFVVLLTDEFTALRRELPRVASYVSLVQQITTLALIKLSSQVALLLLLGCASPLLALATQSVSWVVLTVALSLLGTSMNVELLVSNFIAFWVVLPPLFLPLFIVELKWIK